MKSTKQVTKAGRRLWSCLAFLWVLAVGVSTAMGQARPMPKSSVVTGGGSRPRKVSPELTTFSQVKSLANQRMEVIVQFRQAPTSVHFQRMGKLGGVHTRTLKLVKSGVFNLPLSAIKALENDPDVLYVSPNRSVKLTASDEYEATVGADAAQSYGWDGTGVGVAVIDSGIADHPDLHDPVTGASRVVYSESFVAGLDATDQYGHGTHVAGIIAGNGQSSGGNGKNKANSATAIFGVAPNVKLINLRVLDANGSGTDAQVIAAIQQAIALKNTYNIKVINLSLGRNVFESYTQDPLCQAVEAAWQAGIMVVVAAGNSGRDNSMNTNGYGTIGAPGNDPFVLTVGATRTMQSASRNDDRVASFSSKGPTLIDHLVKPDLVAPGNNIASLLASNSTLDNGHPDHEVNPKAYGLNSYAKKLYFILSGTSMATPVTSGAAALLLQQNPS